MTFFPWRFLFHLELIPRISKSDSLGIRFWNFPWLSTHAKFKKSIFHQKILQFVGEIVIILNYLQSWFSLTIKIWVKSIWLENSKIHEIQLIHRLLKSLLKTLNWNNWILSSSDSGVIMDIYRLSKKQSILMRGNNESWVV